MQNYKRVTLKNAAALTVDISYPMDDEAKFTNPQTDQNGLSTTRKICENQSFTKAVIQVIPTATCASAEFVVNNNLDNLIIVQKGGVRVLEYSDQVSIQSLAVTPRTDGAAIGDIIVELSV
jgi:hypothetical protein